MPQSVKLYQILEKANIETKISIEIQDWILETLEEKRDQAMIKFEDTKLLPIHEKVDSSKLEMGIRFERVDERIDLLREEMNSRFVQVDQKFESLKTEMNSRFDSLEKRLDSTNFSIRLLGVPIVGATVGGLGIVFLKIFEAIR